MNTDKVKPFIVMDILERALRLEKEGSPIIHLEIGEPDFRTPQSIIDEAVESLKKGQTHYTDSRGIIELRNAIASYYSKNYGVNVSEEQVLVTMGSSPSGTNQFALQPVWNSDRQRRYERNSWAWSPCDKRRDIPRPRL